MMTTDLLTPKQQEEQRQQQRQQTTREEEQEEDLHHQKSEPQKREILERDADKPLPQETADELKCSVNDRFPAKLALMKKVKEQYPALDFLMIQSVVEHYLDNPRDTPEDITRRAPKDYFDESKAVSSAPVGGPRDDFVSGDNKIEEGYEASSEGSEQEQEEETSTD